MRVLAVDTSSVSGSIAVMEDDALVGEWNTGDVGTHGRWLLTSIDGFLKDLGLGVAMIDLFALARGPGSFTGLRVGASVIKGLAWATGRPVAAVSTLKALAMNATSDSVVDICPVLDARKNRLYAALYRAGPGAGPEIETVIEDCSLERDDLCRQLNEAPGRVATTVFIGHGLDRFGEYLGEHVEGAVAKAPASTWSVKASNIARLALAAPAESFITAAELSPAYLKKSEAEIKRAGRAGGG